MADSRRSQGQGQVEAAGLQVTTIGYILGSLLVLAGSAIPLGTVAAFVAARLTSRSDS